MGKVRKSANCVTMVPLGIADVETLTDVDILVEVEIIVSKLVVLLVTVVEVTPLGRSAALTAPIMAAAIKMPATAIRISLPFPFKTKLHQR